MNRLLLFILVVLVVELVACKSQQINEQDISIIPMPENVTPGTGFSELNVPTDIQTLQLTSLRKTIGGVYPVKKVEVFAANEDGKLTKIGDSGFRDECLIQGRNKIATVVDCPAKAVSKIWVKAELLNLIPEGHHKTGSNSYLMVDEIVVL